MKKTIWKQFDLQFFADAGTLVNATGNYVNAGTGATTAFDSNNTLAPELKAFYDTELLENARAELFYAQFAKRQPLPKNHKGQVEWRKFNTFAPAGKLTEGVIPTGQKFGLITITGTVDQYGTYTSITDKLELRAYDDIILAATEEMGASAAETQEKLIRDALLSGTNVMYCDNINPATGEAASGSGVVVTPTSCAQMEASATAMSLLTPVMINKAVTILKKNRAQSINGKFFAVVYPSVSHDLRNCEGWLEAHRYASPEEIQEQGQRRDLRNLLLRQGILRHHRSRGRRAGDDRARQERDRRPAEPVLDHRLQVRDQRRDDPLPRAPAARDELLELQRHRRHQRHLIRRIKESYRVRKKAAPQTRGGRTLQKGEEQDGRDRE